MLITTYTPPFETESTEAIATLETIGLNGIQQCVSIRGRNTNNPLLLILHGGPGLSEMVLNKLNYSYSALEEHFIVVHWDQRGAGKSFYPNIDPASMTINQLCEDGLLLCHKLLNRFGKKKMFLFGTSWGSILGMKMIERLPQLFFAFAAGSQMVNVRKAEKRSLEITRNYAINQNHKRAIRELFAIKVPEAGEANPFEKYVYLQRKWAAELGALSVKKYKIDLFSVLAGITLTPEYNVADTLRLKTGLAFSNNTLTPQIMGVNLFRQITEIEVPVYFLMGKYDAIASPKLTEKYFQHIKAPHKELIWFNKSNHFLHIEERRKFYNSLIYMKEQQL